MKTRRPKYLRIHSRDCPGVFCFEKWSFCWYFRSQKNTPRRDDSPDMGLLLGHRPTFGISPSASGALFVEKHASLSAPIGDGAVLRRGDLHPIKPARRRQDIVGKPEPQSHARNARPDAREMVPRFATCRRMEPILDFVFRPRDAPVGAPSHAHRAARFARVSESSAYL